MPRAWKEKRDVGGMLITMRFVKTFKRFGFTTITTATETFDNFHNSNRRFSYSCPEPGYDGWGLLNREDCEEYKFAPINSKYLRDVIDKWFVENNITDGGEWK